MFTGWLTPTNRGRLCNGRPRSGTKCVCVVVYKDIGSRSLYSANIYFQSTLGVASLIKQYLPQLQSRELLVEKREKPVGLTCQ